jgi:hypothetical protein
VKEKNEIRLQPKLKTTPSLLDLSSPDAVLGLLFLWAGYWAAWITFSVMLLPLVMTKTRNRGQKAEQTSSRAN